MRTVIPLRYGTVFKKAFSDPEVFTAFVNAVLERALTFTAVQQEHSFHPPIGNVDVRFDLFAEDAEQRVIVELQHVRDADVFSRFYYYHQLAQIEQVSNSRTYATARTVFTIVVLTRLPQEVGQRFDVAVQSSDLVTRSGRALGVLHHRLVILNPRAILPDTPTPLRRWMALVEDSLDEQLEEMDYPEPLLQRVIERIEANRLSPTERAALIDEHEWEEAKLAERDQGLREGLRRAVRGTAAALGVELTEAQLAQLASADGDALEALHVALLAGRRRPDS